jgi:glycine hydroxymethyltransferase
MQSAITFISSGPMPRVVTAGVPMRTPLVTNGLRFSPGTVFLFEVIADCIADCVFDFANKKDEVASKVEELTKKFPLYE